MLIICVLYSPAAVGAAEIPSTGHTEHLTNLQVTVWASTVEDEGFGRSQTSREIIIERKTRLAVTALADPPHAHLASVSGIPRSAGCTIAAAI